MNATERREYARKLVADWPPLTPDARIRIAVLLRPDLPVGIRDHASASNNKKKPA
jgi:hypothetical protein